MTLTLSSPDISALAQSRAYCEQITRLQARNFYYGLKLLPEPKRSAMFALYAYMRLVDDIADDEDGRSIHQRLDDLESWRVQTHAALDGSLADTSHELWPAFADMVQRYKLPAHLFDEVIAGQRQDLEPTPFETFEPLYEYCYRVAGVVGLASIYVWGFDGSEAAEQLAIERGVAFQLTNILRDLREDAGRGRTYLPQDELMAAGVDEDDIRGAEGGEKFLRMMRYQIERAEAYYEKSAALEKHISPECRPTLIAMTDIYRGLLAKIADEPERVLRERVSLSIFSKLRIGWRASRIR
ncbi:MAG TPA: phytoene/squalene synthase family protein [Humisphaera sp.]|nr:phytoene/squalene synthase family protein [Humisphaera sp.]